MWTKTSNLSHLLFRNLDLRFFRWQAPRWECDTCKLHMCAFLRRQAPRWVWQLKAGPSLPFFFALAGSQMKMLQLQSWLSLHFPGQTVENKKWHLTKRTAHKKKVPNSWRRKIAPYTKDRDCAHKTASNRWKWKMSLAKKNAPKKMNQTVENKEWHLTKMIVSRKTRAKQLKIKNGTLPKRLRTKKPEPNSWR